jgi:hypothetical protein
MELENMERMERLKMDHAMKVHMPGALKDLVIKLAAAEDRSEGYMIRKALYRLLRESALLSPKAPARHAPDRAPAPSPPPAP